MATICNLGEWEGGLLRSWKPRIKFNFSLSFHRLICGDNDPYQTPTDIIYTISCYQPWFRYYHRTGRVILSTLTRTIRLYCS